MRAAFYECDITPPLGGFMWGHYTDLRAEDVYEKLYAKAVVVEDNGELAAIVVVDTCALTEEMHDIVTKRIYEYTGITPDRVCITSNHTHSGAPIASDYPIKCFADESYKDVFYRLCADAVTLAYKRLDDVDAKFGTTEVHGISFNRNFELTDGRFVTHGRGKTNIVRALDGIDPALPVLMFERDGKPIGAIINFACHQCCLGEENYHGYSGDYASVMAQKLKEYYGSDFVSLFVLGTCGDINHVDPNKAEDPLYWYREMGHILADAVVRAANEAQPVSGGVKVVKETVEIARRMATAEDVMNLRTRPSNLESEWMQSLKLRNLMYYREVNDRDTSELYVQSIRIGDVCITALPGEIYSDYGLAIKANSPFKRAMVVENCNSYCGYVPTKQAFAPNSEIYESTLCFHSNLVPEAGDILQAKALEQAEYLSY